MYSIVFSSLFLIASFFFQVDASAASFDCSKAKTNHEILICGTPSLNIDDEEMGRVYRLARKYKSDTKGLVDGQRKFLTLYNRCASSNNNDQNIKTCTALLGERLKQLKSIYREGLSSLENSPCKENDYDYAEHWNYYYDPIEAYEFGENIKRLVRDENIEAILDLIDGELDGLPLRKNMQGKSFSDIFTSDWTRKILESKSSCGPVGYRGFILGNGFVWYNGKSGRITSINGLEPPEPKTENAIWVLKGAKLTPKCFAYNWYSGDNYENFYEARINKKSNYNDTEFLSFINSPGLFWGGLIDDYSAVPTEWDSHPEIEIPVSIHSCKEGKTNLSVSKNKTVSLSIKKSSGADSDLSSYKIIKDMDVSACKILAPQITKQCLSIKLIEKREPSGGSIGDYGAVNIYAIYEIDGIATIFPLKNFQLNEKNKALAYVENIEKESISTKGGLKLKGLKSGASKEKHEKGFDTTESSVCGLDKPGNKPILYPVYKCDQFILEHKVDKVKAVTTALETIKTTLNWIADSAAYEFYIEMSTTNINNLLSATLAAHGRTNEDMTEVIYFLRKEIKQVGASEFLIESCANQKSGTINNIASSYYMAYQKIKHE